MSAGAAEAARILVVEDSPTQALQIRRVLESQGFRVEDAATAEAALESLDRSVPDLVIADYYLPGMNGDELSRQIRLNLRTRATPVLMLTEARERELERQGLESGADIYLPKSGDHALLLARIRALLRGRAASEAGEAAPGLGGFRRPRVLLVDGDAASRASLLGRLVDDGCAAEVATNEKEALRQAVTPGAEWDCVIVNVLSPGFDGIALCARLNALRVGPPEGGEEPPAFRIVGLGDDLERAFEAGADDLVPAADPDVLTLRIRAVVRRKRLQDDKRRIEAGLRAHELTVARMRAEAAAAEARAALAEELEETNRQLRDAQAKLVQAAKMASLGELVAGIAHEINNPLAFILAHQGTVGRLLAEIGDAVADGALAGKVAKCRDRAAAMGLGLRRIQDLVLNLRRFSRLDESGFQAVDVPEAVETVLALLAHKLGGRITVERRFEAPAELVCAPALLNQVVMNIVSNAADAIPGDGRIAIATRLDGGDYVIEIRDSGPGVPEALRERVFEPFFTTKPVGSGTGLGLAIAYTVVRAHQGSIIVSDAPEGGARFTVTIPQRAGP